MARGESLTHSAYERIRADILACRIEPGARISIVDVAAALDVSPGAIREALSRLTAEGLVLAEPQRGFRAAEVSASDLRDLTAVRIEIEQLCIRDALTNGDLAWESRLVAAHHELTRTSEREAKDQSRLADAWSSAHAAFHEALVSGGKSRYLGDIRRLLYARSERYRQLSIPLARSKRDTGSEHRALVDAAIARDADRVSSLVARHLTTTTKILLEALYPAEGGKKRTSSRELRSPRSAH